MLVEFLAKVSLYTEIKLMGPIYIIKIENNKRVRKTSGAL